MEQVILVDFEDCPLGTCEKLEAHEKGLLHRAFSVFLFREDSVLLQKRAKDKYHAPSLWANTCCSHPRLEETVQQAAHRRLKEECGIEGVHLQEVGHLLYRYAFDNGLIEFEYDHLFVGEYDGSFEANLAEIAEMEWVQVDVLQQQMLQEPARFAPWTIMTLPLVLAYLKQ